MDVREKLAELLGKAKHEVWCSREKYNGTEFVAGYLVAHGVTVQEWIPVSERLPDKSDYYLYKANNPYRGLKNGVGVSYFRHKAKKWNATNGDFVTHWMPLPQPPKGE